MERRRQGEALCKGAEVWVRWRWRWKQHSEKVCEAEGYMGEKKVSTGLAGGSKTAGVLDPLALPFDLFSRTGRMLVSFSGKGRRDFSHE